MFCDENDAPLAGKAEERTAERKGLSIRPSTSHVPLPSSLPLLPSTLPSFQPQTQSSGYGSSGQSGALDETQGKASLP